VHGGFIPGTRRRTMEIPNAPRALPLICYEAIFPGNVAARDDRPGWIVNLTNDGWCGNSTGPYQHLQQARLRAIEEGLPMVRAANTGISAVIDPRGVWSHGSASASTVCWTPACRRRCRRRFMLALEISRLPSSWPPPCCSSSDAAPQSTLPEISASLVVAGLLKNANCVVPPVDRQPAIRFLRLQAKNNNQSPPLLRSSAILPDPPSRI
jgi:hypothetical protein